MNANFKKYANVEYTEAEISEINSRTQKKIFPFGDTEVSLILFQPNKEGNLFKTSPHDDCVIEYMPIFKSIEGAQQPYFWKIALNWSKGLNNERIGFQVRDTFNELKELGIDPFNLSKVLGMTEGKGVEMLTGLKAVMRKDWSPNKFHLQYFKDKKCSHIVDIAGNILTTKEIYQPESGATREEYKVFHAQVAQDVLECTARKNAYEAMPAVKLLKLETANNSSINKLFKDFIERRTAGAFPKIGGLDDDIPF